jgi:MYXO-CTERM domain-containing protein
LASLLVAVYPARALAATVVEGGSVGGQIWTPQASPYLVRAAAELTVPAGEELRMEAGTTVLFPADSAALLTVEGRLTISGTRTAQVTLEAEAYTGKWVWRGILVKSGGTVSINGMAIRHALAGLQWASEASTGSITSSTFEDCETGVSVSRGAIRIDANTFAKNDIGIFSAGGEATVTNSIFSDARLDGIAASAGLVRAINCTFDHNYIGIWVGVAVEVRNSIFSNNNRAVEASSSTRQTIVSSTFWANNFNLLLHTSGSSTEVSGAGNEYLDPQYVAATDLRLSASSPCIDSGTAAGAPDHDLAFVARPQEGDLVPDSDGSTFDRGAYEFVADGSGGGEAGGSGGADGGSSTDGAGTGNAGGSGGANDETGAGGGRNGAGGAEALGGSAGRVGSAGGGAASAEGGASNAAGASGESGKTGGASSGGSSGSGGVSSASGGVGTGAAGERGNEASCNCRAVGPKPRNSGALIAAFALVALARYRRRQASTPPGREGPSRLRRRR